MAPEFALAASGAVFGVEADGPGFAEFDAGALFVPDVTRSRGVVSEADDGPVGWFPAAGPVFFGSAATSKGRPPDPGLDATLLGDCV